ncbi:Ig-like domain-containing protein [Hyalangium sp.]|uniref:Ig-like domain-containing protein n=1 Tax=Hyalangium sp. TaxID=2028555 RepID=UPI002D5F166B|nr:Ig-like domain-containing protein [Hyalangium sp.]HYH96540.1 Ig-like domain-containing protein [Hyalangium sp.]
MVAPLMVSPGWSFTGALTTTRLYHTATLLPSGKVLVTGGYGGWSSAEVYDPATGAWSPTGSMAMGRNHHRATLLPSGKVLVTGGTDLFGNDLASAEVYDPATGTWSPTSSMAGPRQQHIATLLPSGKVLVIGGYRWGSSLPSAAVYDPATGVWSPTGSLATARYGHTATLLPSGKVLVTGGMSTRGSAEVYDPAIGAWSPTDSMAMSRYGHTATLLPSGKVLVAGGHDTMYSAEVYDPATGAWTLTGSMAKGRYSHSATLLPSGKVLVTGRSSSELYDPATGAWSPTGSMATARDTHRATLLSSGNVLVSGGHRRAEVYSALIVVAPAYDSTTSDSTPAYSGMAEADSTITLIVDDSPVGTTMADPVGNWSFTPPTALADGPHTVRATATDAGGITSAHSSINTFMVDATPPAAPVVVAPANSSTVDDTPTCSGMAEADSTVTLIVDDSPVGTATADAAGHWTFTPTTALADGPHTVRATATDAVGNTSADSSTHTFMVDATPPAAPAVVAPANGSTIRDNTPTYSGTAEAGSTVVTLIVDGSPVGTTMADAAGNWDFAHITALADGPRTVRATVTDAVGNTSAHSSTHTFMVDATPPASPVVVAPANGSTIRDNTRTYSGTAEAGSTVTLIVDDSPVGTATADAAGHWTFTPTTALADGPRTVRATATDAVGNTSADSRNTFMVDTTPPAAPAVVAPANGSTIGDNTPTYSGTAEVGSTVTLIVDDSSVGTAIADAAGSWDFTPTTALADGPRTVRATATDAVGNVNPTSVTRSFTVDTMPPGAPEMSLPETFNTQKPVIAGMAEPNGTITIWLDGTEAGTAAATGTGLWVFSPDTELTEGDHQVKATARDAVGNVSSDSAELSFTIVIIKKSHYGWSCATAPAFPATWALLTLSVALRRRWLKSRPGARSDSWWKQLTRSGAVARKPRNDALSMPDKGALLTISPEPVLGTAAGLERRLVVRPHHPRLECRRRWL